MFRMGVGRCCCPEEPTEPGFPPLPIYEINHWSVDAIDLGEAGEEFNEPTTVGGLQCFREFFGQRLRERMVLIRYYPFDTEPYLKRHMEKVELSFFLSERLHNDSGDPVPADMIEIGRVPQSDIFDGPPGPDPPGNPPFASEQQTELLYDNWAGYTKVHGPDVTARVFTMDITALWEDFMADAASIEFIMLFRMDQAFVPDDGWYWGSDPFQSTMVIHFTLP